MMDAKTMIWMGGFSLAVALLANWFPEIFPIDLRTMTLVCSIAFFTGSIAININK